MALSIFCLVPSWWKGWITCPWGNLTIEEKMVIMYWMDSYYRHGQACHKINHPNSYLSCTNISVYNTDLMPWIWMFQCISVVPPHKGRNEIINMWIYFINFFLSISIFLLKGILSGFTVNNYDLLHIATTYVKSSSSVTNKTFINQTWFPIKGIIIINPRHHSSTTQHYQILLVSVTV